MQLVPKKPPEILAHFSCGWDPRTVTVLIVDAMAQTGKGPHGGPWTSIKHDLAHPAFIDDYF